MTWFLSIRTEMARNEVDRLRIKLVESEAEVKFYRGIAEANQGERISERILRQICDAKVDFMSTAKKLEIARERLERFERLQEKRAKASRLTSP